MPKRTQRRRVKGSTSRGAGKKWILILLAVLLLIPAMQVAVVRFVTPPWTLPMLIEQGGAMFSSAPTRPLLYRRVDLPLAGPILVQERTGVVRHDLDGNAVAEAAHPGAVCQRDRDGARDLW